MIWSRPAITLAEVADLSIRRVIHEHTHERRGRLNRVTGAVAMLYMARTEHLQADESIHCEEVTEADAVTTPWALLAWIGSIPGDSAAWRLVGTYASETAALTARRRLSRRLGSATSARLPLEPLQ